MKHPNKNYRCDATIFVFVLTIIFFVTNCSRKKSASPKELSRLLKDADSNSYHSKLMLDGKLWMTDNLNTPIPESFCYDEKELNCATYGRLYTWEAAKKGCEMLGNGWRLPTNEEWQTMSKEYGGIVDDSEDKGKSAYTNLAAGGNAEFNAVLGGNREPNGEYARLGAHGFYWTATEYDSANAWFYNFAHSAVLLNRHTGEKERAVSVRCIKELEN
jgi:uncharacterized protein (TIGR02145 family)